MAHTSVRQGKQVIVFMHDGSHFNAKFRQSTKKYVLFYDHPRVWKRHIRTVSLARQGCEYRGIASWLTA